MKFKEFFKENWRGGLIGLVVGIFFSWFYQITAQALNCHEIYLSTVWERCNFLGALVKTPALSTIKLFGLSEMGELLVLIYLPLIGLILGFLISYLVKKKIKLWGESSPFKMWESWIGVIIGLVVHTFVFHDGNFLDLFKFGVHIINGILFTVGGFLLGWGIQSFFLKRRK